MTFSRRKLKITVVAGLALGACASVTHAKDTAQQAAAKKAIAARYVTADRATERLDIGAFMAMCTPDYQTKLKNGTVMNRAESEMYLRQAYSAPGLKVTSSRTTINKMELKGSDAIVLASSTVHMKVGNNTVEVVGSMRDLWHSKNGKWFVKQSAELKSDVKVNGRAVPAQ